MKSWKVWVPIAVVLGAIAVGVGVWLWLQIFAAVSPPIQAADRFLGLLGQGKTAEAYQSTASTLRKRLNAAQFAQRVKQLGLTEFESSSFPKVEFKDGTARLEGSFTRKDGSTVQLNVTVAKEGEAWRVAAFRGPVPDRAVILDMVRTSLRDFNAAVQSGDFTAFHKTLAMPFREQFSAERIKDTFQAFVDHKVDLRGALQLDPIFSPAPSIGARQTLRVVGYFPSTPSRLHFDLKYVPEDGVWKLLSIAVNVKPQDK
jgi:hypothetical protein